MMCHCRFINYNKSVLVGLSIVGEAMPVGWEREGYMGTLYFLHYLSVNVTLKKMSI